MVGTWLLLEFNLVDWLLFFLASGIIFGILWRKLRADIDQWMKGRASARGIDGSPAP